MFFLRKISLKIACKLSIKIETVSCPCNMCFWYARRGLSWLHSKGLSDELVDWLMDGACDRFSSTRGHWHVLSWLVTAVQSSLRSTRLRRNVVTAESTCHASSSCSDSVMNHTSVLSTSTEISEIPTPRATPVGWSSWFTYWLYHLGQLIVLIDWLIDWHMDGRTDGLTDWLINGLTDWLIDGLTDWLTDWLIDWLIDWLMDWLIYWCLTSIFWLQLWKIDCLKVERTVVLWNRLI